MLINFNYRSINGFSGCEVGYVGYNCTEPCRYPSFGYRCQHVCNCTQDMCNHKTGCSLPQSTTKETNNHIYCDVRNVSLFRF